MESELFGDLLNWSPTSAMIEAGFDWLNNYYHSYPISGTNMGNYDSLLNGFDSSIINALTWVNGIGGIDYSNMYQNLVNDYSSLFGGGIGYSSYAPQDLLTTDFSTSSPLVADFSSFW